MGANVAEEGEVIIRRRRWPRILAVVALLLGLVVLGLWLARKPLARDEIDQFLAGAGVPARYTITDLGLGRQRLTNVVIGDPAKPDLVADWLETRTRWGLRGPVLAGVRGAHVRVRARWADGKLSLGSIDRLLPKGEAGRPFALPALALDVDDLRARIETPWGLVGAKLTGGGRLDGGFDGRLAVTSAALGEGACRATRPDGVWRVRTRGAGPTTPPRLLLDGSTQVEALECAGATTGYANANGKATVTLGDRIDWTIAQDVAATDLRHPAARAQSLAGRVTLASGAIPGGQVSLRAQAVHTRYGAAAVLSVNGPMALSDTGVSLGRRSPAVVTLQTARLSPALLQWADGLAVGDATPIAPLLARGTRAIQAAGKRFDVNLRGSIAADRTGGSASVIAADAHATSGAIVAWSGDAGLRWGDVDATKAGGRLSLAGGGLPTASVTIRQNRSGTLSGAADIRPYTTGTASLALTRVRFAETNGGWQAVTTATLSGPLGDGRVDGLTLPIDATWRGGVVTLGSDCAAIGWRRIATAGLILSPGRLRLCPDGPTLVRIVRGGVDGGARIAAARLTGRLGSTPLTLMASGARLRLGDRGAVLSGVEAVIGAAARATRVTIGTLDGRLTKGVVAGHFTDAGGRIGTVPLAMSAAAGTWRFAGRALKVDGTLTVADTATPARFQPLAARAVTLRLESGSIVADGALYEPATNTRVAGVAIRHDLAAGRGTADLTVPALAFVKGFQPDQLTRLTFGVIADVRGTVTGDAHLAWTPAGVTSIGTFRTAGTDLAAAFGPVTGLAGEIRFTDLLQLQSAPGQQVTVKSINPGVPVTDGVITFQTLPGTRVAVEDGRWPFAGGALTLDPTLLDFSASAQRRLTFHVTGAAADQFLQSFDFKNLDATGTFDGVLPMVFDASGGRIENGRLAVRPGGGTIAYVGDISRKNLGFWGNFAFDTLKSLRYRSLGIVMNGPLAGEMVTEVRFAGISQGKGAKTNFLIRRLQRLPVVFNIRIRAPFRGLLDATASFYDPKRLIERNLPELIQRRNQTIQPPASETVP